MRSLLIPLLMLIVCRYLVAASEPALARYEFTEPQMGVPFKIVVYAPSDEAANRAASAAYVRVAALNAILSDYEEDSELSRLSRGSPHPQPVKVSDDLWRVLSRAHELSKATDGAFDITVGPLVQLWRRARRQRELPRPDLLRRALAATGYQALELDPERQTARLTKPNMRLDLGGIGIGYAVDEAMKVLKQSGIRSAMIDASGDIAVSETPPLRKSWVIGISPDANGNPTRFVALSNAALTTTSDEVQYVEINGVRYSHIVDPKTGLGLTDRSSATVIASDCTTADSYDTAITVMGPERGLKLVEATRGVEAIITRLENGMRITVESRGFKSFETMGPLPSKNRAMRRHGGCSFSWNVGEKKCLLPPLRSVNLK
jgi:thiamine biosynthesis lipoprotein